MKKSIVFLSVILGCVLFALPSHAVLVEPGFLDFDAWKDFECPFGECTNSFKNQDVGENPGDLVINGISFHFYREGDEMFFDWSSSQGVCALLVKAGGKDNGGALFYNYKNSGLLPTSDTGLHAPFNTDSEKYFDVSNVSGCAVTPEPSTLLLIGTGLIAITIPRLRNKLKK